MTAQKKNAKKRNPAANSGSSGPFSEGNSASRSEAREWTAEEMANAKPLPIPTTEATFLPPKTATNSGVSPGGKPRE